MTELGKTQRDLRNLLLYTQELLSFHEKIIFDLSREPYPAFHEYAVVGFEGVDAGLDEETWLQIHRLRPNPPPAPDPIFDGWYSLTHSASPDRPPQLADHRLINVSADEASNLMEAGLVADPADVMKPVNSDEECPARVDVILRLSHMPEFRASWQSYLDGPWKTWADAERPRRRSIELYNKLYEIHQRMLSFGDDNPIELVFGVGMALWQVKSVRVAVPLIEQLVELELDADGTLSVRPRASSPQLTLKAFHALEIDGSKTLQRDAGQQLARVVEDPDVGFSPFDTSTFELVLRSCTVRLSASGVYVPDVLDDPSDRNLPTADETLRVTDTWVLSVRQRTEDVRRDDIQRLIKKVEDANTEESLPDPGVRFVKPPSDERLYAGQSGIDLSNTDLILPETIRGWSEPTGANVTAVESAPHEEIRQHDATYFFPLPYNDEQFEIIRYLERAEGVVVQGPPGTGKTHTIANIICHYLATQRRVLVTAKTPEALTALREKLPEGIADLAIAVIHNDREGARQLEKAVAILANEAKQVNVRIVGQEIRDKQGRLAGLREEIARIDHELHVYAERNLSKVTFRGEEFLPMELATRVLEERPRHAWFEDELTLDPKFKPRFDDDVAEMRRLRAMLGADIAYTADDLPRIDAFPQIARILAAHGELARLGEIDGRAGSGEILYMSIDGDAGLRQAQEMKEWLEDFRTQFEGISRELWLLPLYHSLLGARRIDEPALTVLRQTLRDWVETYRRGREFQLRAIYLGDLLLDDPAFERALLDLAARGKKRFGFFSFFKGGLKERVESIRIEGRAPASQDEWQIILDYRVWQRKAREFIGRWGGVAHGLGVPALPSEFDAALPELFRLGRPIEALWRFVEEAEARMTALSRLFPYGIDPKEVIHHGRCEKVLEALTANLEKVGLADARAVRASLEATVGNTALPFHAALAEVIANLGNGEVPQVAMAQAWQDILDEAARLAALRDTRLRLNKLADTVAQSGASKWARRLCVDPVSGDQDRWTPIGWRDTWEWARASGFIRDLSDRSRIEWLAERRAQAEREQKRLFADIVRLRTFLGLKEHLTGRVEAALQKFVTAIARLGRGTGKAAVRQRRIIRDAAMDAAAAVPCWILPEWRVSEQLPPELGAFDLVIIDEASQSDITALPAVLRGKQLLIVGDDKQVSPSTVGLEDRKIIQLRSTYLAGLPFADQMEPAISLYELGSMIFPGKVIMLREHFRCVEPIIRFSSRFYSKALIPLRVPKASERLDPPLVDIYVPHGEKRGDLNHAEVDVVVREIRKLVEDPAFARRSIGVISLIGDAQAKLIYTRLVRELGAEVMEQHRIMCGSSATFQGQERDVMFLSMVACPETTRAQTSRIFEQRFNVALSRARDRLVLVRSVASSHLKPGDLKLAVIEHFRNPMGEGQIAPTTDILELCESGFERAFGKRIIDLGYRIRPQIPVAGKRIDFVIDGADDRRLAIELDGDKYHGPDRWAEDFCRQKALERLGWTFWRCWGSSWIADPDGCLADLRSVLSRLKIEPLGPMPVDGVYTLHVEETSPRGPSNDALWQETVPPEVLPAEPIPVTRRDTAVVPTNAASEGSASSEIPASMSTPSFPPLLPVSSQGHTVGIGDTVVIRYNDAPNRPIRVKLSREANRPESGLLHISLPLAQALLGCRVDDEVEVQIASQFRKAVIEHIEKPA